MNDSYYIDRVRKGDRFFNKLSIAKIFQKDDDERKIRLLKAMAYFSFFYHSGRFTSEFINREIRKIADSFSVNKLDVSRSGSNNVVVYIAKELDDSGGNTRLLENIATFYVQSSKQNILILTDQRLDQLPSRVATNSELFVNKIGLKGLAYREAIEKLLTVIRSAELVLNFQHPYEILPSIALVHRASVKTIYVNHADHAFWIGAAFCDSILNLRPYALELTRSRRNDIVVNTLLPVKIDLSRRLVCRDEAKQKLGHSGETIFLTISKFSKVFPDSHYNFFSTILTLLTKYSEAIYYFVGVTEDEFRSVMNQAPPKNLLLLGIIKDPFVYQCAADLYLEGMPQGSLTALIESIYAGAMPILMWGPYYPNVIMESEIYIDSIVTHPQNRDQYFKSIQFALDPQNKQAINEIVNKIKARIDKYNSSQYWHEMLDNIETQVIPNRSQMREFALDKVDLRLSEMLESSSLSRRENLFFEALRIAGSALTSTELLKLWWTFLNDGRKMPSSRCLGILGRLLFRKYFRAAPEGN